MSSPDPRLKLIQEYRKLHEKMKPFCLESGISPEIYDLAILSVEKISFDSLVSDMEFLQKFHDGAYGDAKSFKAERPDEWWKNLGAIFSRNNLPEQRLLAEKQTRLRKAWRNRYGRAKTNPKQNGDSGVAEELRVRPEEPSRDEGADNVLNA